MMLGLLLMVGLVQDGWTTTPAVFTVGDTVVVERTLNIADAATRLRVGPLESNDDFQAIRPPEVDYVEGGAVVRYFIAPFQTDPFTITPPDVDLVHPEGPIETLPGGTITVQPTSILPDRAARDSQPAPKWSQSPIPRGTARYDFAVILGFLALAFAVVWGLARRRIGVRPVWDVTPVSAQAPVTQWVTAGEPRAVAALIMTRVREDLARRVPEAGEALSIEEVLDVLRNERPHWPVDSIADILNSVARASFAPAVPTDVLVTVEEIKELHQALDLADAKPDPETEMAGGVPANVEPVTPGVEAE